MNESRHRINKTTAALMIIVAVIFDVAQVASKLLAFMGLGTIGGFFGVLACQYLGVDAPGTCATIGSATGVATTFIPVVGTALAGAAAAVGAILSELASSLFMLCGYATISIWLFMDGAPLFSGTNISKKVASGFVAVIVDVTPILNIMPGLTIWTITMIMTTRAEDKKKDMTEQSRYNEEDDTEDMQDFSRVRRGPNRRYVHADTF